MDRIAAYVASGSAKIPEDAFKLFNKYVANILQSHQATMEVNDILELQIVSYLDFDYRTSRARTNFSQTYRMHRPF